MGRFKLGSTVIVLFGPKRLRWLDLPGTRAGTDGRNPGIARQHRHFISRKRINIS
ncbi:phosphatidylserine decarboxylase proenzyme [Bordetella pertussis]|nr:phosphatidylserine decarboxylase proenzyme [Bordetella pertussis]